MISASDSYLSWIGKLGRHIITARFSRGGKGSERGHSAFVKMVPEAQPAVISCKKSMDVKLLSNSSFDSTTIFPQTLQQFSFLNKGAILPVSSSLFLFFLCVWQLLFDLFIGSDLFHVSAKD